MLKIEPEIETETDEIETEILGLDRCLRTTSTNLLPMRVCTFWWSREWQWSKGRELRPALTRLSSNGKRWRRWSLIDRWVVVQAFLIDMRHLDKSNQVESIRSPKHWKRTRGDAGCRAGACQINHSFSYDLGCSRKDLRFRRRRIGRHRWNGRFDRCLLWAKDSLQSVIIRKLSLQFRWRGHRRWLGWSLITRWIRETYGAWEKCRQGRDLFFHCCQLMSGVYSRWWRDVHRLEMINGMW